MCNNNNATNTETRKRRRKKRYQPKANMRSPYPSVIVINNVITEKMPPYFRKSPTSKYGRPKSSSASKLLMLGKLVMGKAMLPEHIRAEANMMV